MLSLSGLPDQGRQDKFASRPDPYPQLNRWTRPVVSAHLPGGPNGPSSSCNSTPQRSQTWAYSGPFFAPQKPRFGQTSPSPAASTGSAEWWFWKPIWD